uniref:Rho GTPase activating protein 44 n=1 Tax=Malurus cyaneus samueli TaxID=2593467 RepID=A0A8C5TQK7_9PASS
MLPETKKQRVEKRLELVKQVSHSTHKKLTACLQGQQGLDADKRSKKLPLTTLAQCLMDAAVWGMTPCWGKRMLRLCGEAEDKLAQELIHFELQVERDVIEPLFRVEIPNIQKQRKHLAKLVLDMDSSRTRWQQSVKSSGLASNLQPSGAKADALREEMEEAANRVEICRVGLHVASVSPSTPILKSRYTLCLPEAWMEKPSFGKPLEEHLAVSGREIAFPVEACVTMLLECGLQEEGEREGGGLFRVAPSASKLKKLKAALDCCVVDVQEYSADPHAIAGALKSYLRELPEPLMTFELYEEWIQASNIPEQEKRLQALWNACEKLPKANYNNIRYVIKFLAKLTEYQDMNKMTPSNVAIVLGPNLLWPQAEGNMTEMMTTLSLQIVGIIEPLIQHADWFFPGDIEFNVTGNYGSPLHVNHNANYSSMPSPDMDHGERRQHDQARRPLSVATDNMMLEFYKKDGMGVRVMDTSWVARRGTSTGRKATWAPWPRSPGPPPTETWLEMPGRCREPLREPITPELFCPGSKSDFNLHRSEREKVPKSTLLPRKGNRDGAGCTHSGEAAPGGSCVGQAGVLAPRGLPLRCSAPLCQRFCSFLNFPSFAFLLPVLRAFRRPQRPRPGDPPSPGCAARPGRSPVAGLQRSLPAPAPLPSLCPPALLPACPRWPRACPPLSPCSVSPRVAPRAPRPAGRRRPAAASAPEVTRAPGVGCTAGRGPLGWERVATSAGLRSPRGGREEGAGC